MAQTPLRIGIILQDPSYPPDWCVRLTEQLEADPNLHLSAIVTGKPGVGGAGGNGLIRWWNKVERWLLARPVPADRESYLLRAKGLPILPIDDRAAIERLGLDVVLDLTRGSGSMTDPALARYGIWFLDFLRNAPGHAGIASIISSEPVTTIALCRAIDGSRERPVIAAVNLNTKFVAALNELFMCEKSVTLVMRELRRTFHFGSPQQEPDVRPGRSAQVTTADFLSYLAGAAKNGLGRIWEKVLAKFGMRPGIFFLKSAESSQDDFQPQRAAAHWSDGNTFYADPFLWQRDGALYCFFEEYDYRTGKGHISAGRFEGDELIDIQPVLRTDYHLSFPYLFEHGGELFMMPETCATRRIEIWKCREFPARWELHTTALEGVCAADSTLNLIGEEWWLFTNISNDPFGEMNSELHLFRVSGPDFGHIEAHPLNPVVMNSRTARNAGRILQVGGKLYRPSQDNSHGTYGYGLNVMEIAELSLVNYNETSARYIGPDFEPGLIGCHHFDSRCGKVVIDVRKRVGGLARPGKRRGTA